MTKGSDLLVAALENEGKTENAPPPQQPVPEQPGKTETKQTR